MPRVWLLDLLTWSQRHDLPPTSFLSILRTEKSNDDTKQKCPQAA